MKICSTSNRKTQVKTTKQYHSEHLIAHDVDKDVRKQKSSYIFVLLWKVIDATPWRAICKLSTHFKLYNGFIHIRMYYINPIYS